MPFFRNPYKDRYGDEFRYYREPLRDRRGCLPDGCAYQLLPIVIVLACLLFLAITFHPQGFSLIPWLIDHL